MIHMFVLVMVHVQILIHVLVLEVFQAVFFHFINLKGNCETGTSVNCYGIPSSNSSVCNGRGSCGATDTCTCTSGVIFFFFNLKRCFHNVFYQKVFHYGIYLIVYVEQVVH
jgi:hypothetical protein